jgi:hypothetical protein
VSLQALGLFVFERKKEYVYSEQTMAGEILKSYIENTELKFLLAKGIYYYEKGHFSYYLRGSSRRIRFLVRFLLEWERKAHCRHNSVRHARFSQQLLRRHNAGTCRKRLYGRKLQF